MAIVNPFDLLGDDDTDPTELTGLHEEIIKKTNDEKKKAREELARAKALAEKKAAKYQKRNRANVEKFGKETKIGGTDARDNGRGYARNGQNNWESLSGRGYGNNRNLSGYSGGYNNAVGDGGNNYSTGSERQSYNGSYRGGYRNGDGGASYGRAPPRQSDHQNYNNGDVGGNYERTSQRQYQDGKGNGGIEETLEDGFVLPPRRHVTRQSLTVTGIEKLSESSPDHGTTKTAVDGVLTQEPLEISKTENNTLILENEVKKDELPASDANNEEKEKKEAELPASEANNEQKANVAEEEKKMTLVEYEKILEEKRKPLLALTTTEERKVQLDKEFQSMQQLSLKNQKDANLRDEKMKKLSGRTTVPQGSVKGEKKKEVVVEEAKRQELLKNVRNVLRRERYQRPRPPFREGGYGGQISSDTVQSNGSQGPQSVQGPGGQTSSDIAPSNGSQGYGNRPARGYGVQTSSDTVQSNGNQGNGNRPQSGRAQSNRNQGYGNHRQFGQGSKPQNEASAPSLENSAEFPPLKIGKV